MDYTLLRKEMVEEQLIPRGIKEQYVLDAFYKVARHKFIPEEQKEFAYADHPLPIGQGQTISQPYIVALMTQCLKLDPELKVLEIGTGSGYQAAILAELVKEVYSVERFPALAKNAASKLAELGYNNIKIKVGDGTLGWPEEAPFDRIIITAACPEIPPPLIEQLKEGGKIIFPRGENYSQMLTLLEKKKSGIFTQEICGCVFVPLVGKFGLLKK